jgi:sulfur-oxidizing protein SoxX
MRYETAAFAPSSTMHFNSTSHLTLRVFSLVASFLMLSGCTAPEQSSRGFRLPEGSSEKGKAAFLRLQCHACHVIQGAELPAPGSKSPITVVLGGEVMRVRTYGELVTSIINPTHVISEKFQQEIKSSASPMPEYNDSMTVADLINLVTYLQPFYQKIQPDTWVIR